MEHRRRLMQHKVGKSTLLKMALAKKKKSPLPQEALNKQCLVTTLATEAIQSLQKTDTTYLKKDEWNRLRIRKKPSASFA